MKKLKLCFGLLLVVGLLHSTMAATVSLTVSNASPLFTNVAYNVTATLSESPTTRLSVTLSVPVNLGKFPATGTQTHILVFEAGETVNTTRLVSEMAGNTTISAATSDAVTYPNTELIVRFYFSVSMSVNRIMALGGGGNVYVTLKQSPPSPLYLTVRCEDPTAVTGGATVAFSHGAAYVVLTAVSTFQKTMLHIELSGNDVGLYYYIPEPIPIYMLGSMNMTLSSMAATRGTNVDVTITLSDAPIIEPVLVQIRMEHMIGTFVGSSFRGGIATILNFDIGETTKMTSLTVGGVSGGQLSAFVPTNAFPVKTAQLEVLQNVTLALSTAAVVPHSDVVVTIEFSAPPAGITTVTLSTTDWAVWAFRCRDGGAGILLWSYKKDSVTYME